MIVLRAVVYFWVWSTVILGCVFVAVASVGWVGEVCRVRRRQTRPMSAVSPRLRADRIASVVRSAQSDWSNR